MRRVSAFTGSVPAFLENTKWGLKAMMLCMQNVVTPFDCTRIWSVQSPQLLEKPENSSRRNGLPAWPKFHSIALSGYVSKVFPPSLQSLTLEKLSELACYITFPLQDMIINAQRTGRGLLEVHDFRCPQIIASYLTSLGLFFFRSSWRVTTQHNMYVMTSHNCCTCRETLHIDLAAKHALTAYTNSSCTFTQGS